MVWGSVLSFIVPWEDFNILNSCIYIVPENISKYVQWDYLAVCPNYKSVIRSSGLLKQPTLQDGLAVLIFYLMLSLLLFLFFTFIFLSSSTLLLLLFSLSYFFVQLVFFSPSPLLLSNFYTLFILSINTISSIYTILTIFFYWFKYQILIRLIEIVIISKMTLRLI